MSNHRGLFLTAAIVALSGGLLGACGTTSSATALGTADVAYAGSLEYLNTRTIGPDFHAEEHYGYEGRGAGSFGLAREIDSSEITPNVFESVGSAPIQEIEPKHTTWYVTFAASPIVIVYNPSTPYARVFRAVAEGRAPLRDAFLVMEKPGFLLGRTNPNTDPQGQAFYEMVELAQSRYHLGADAVSRIVGSVDNPAEVFSETSVLARLEAGQLDASSAFLSEALEEHLDYIALPNAINFGDPSLASTYSQSSVTLSNGKVFHGVPLTLDATVVGHEDMQAADAFVAFQLSKKGQHIYAKAGYIVGHFGVFGHDVPRVVTDALKS
jgi:molybdate/tungstate transport system substrate-binding protein